MLEGDETGPVGACALGEDDDLRPLTPGLTPALDLLDGVDPRVGVLPPHQHRLGELYEGWWGTKGLMVLFTSLSFFYSMDEDL